MVSDIALATLKNTLVFILSKLLIFFYFQPVICIVIVFCVSVFVGIGYMCGCWCPHATACMGRSEDNFPESILSPYLVLKAESFLLFLLNWLLQASRLMNVWRVGGITDPAKCFFLPAEHLPSPPLFILIVHIYQAQYGLCSYAEMVPYDRVMTPTILSFRL